ncbi:MULTISPECIES: phage tail tape measure protein [unclassified Agrobacterium]|uniref:phage tail tape measure protein n=1 Tax=unclassified Agrobacterium TaxID=2632611 RepID=UPI0024470DAC|nr:MULTISPECIES: phage tail tape measure protein [unclassified Agrobacterium]MDH0612274.1 phage tail tape measure protein [Agrobacterium sp. GD03872]MDH0696171.1 phage tail tape measure protein [Agrobacterium sp. GD03871]MDH1059074.1 phage tail tape measure protein [Agrobacterium sp. GD03992]MDH2210435.1 phage tail tape measure protein [Agrobacterium sp. GD03643]MDH2217939.1 phage tail tape measure protein [Agrobacterium sp. GD03638]
MGVQQSSLRISLIDDATATARHIGRALDGLRAQSASAFAPMRGLIGQAVALGAGYFGVTRGLEATAGAAISFESAFADVKKVVEANEEQFENMRRSIRRMSGEIPLAANDIAALFAAAGESGIATEDLQSFAEMAARVGIAFDLGAAEAGESLAKLKTQLGLTVAETGDMADAINHLSNNMASKAKDVTEFMLRVGSFGEMGGFAKEELAAMGSAMISAGSDASTAGTAMLNVIRALTKGEFAKKSQRDAAKALGLHLPSIAKGMQKDAKGTMRKVLTAIAKAPKDKQVSLLSEFFGDEARAFMPLVGNIKLLDQALDSVADRTKYAGSAFNEYIQRASTTQNVLDLLGNKISNVFSEIGDSMLPTIREGAQGIGEVLDTLGNRVTIFDQITNFTKGFAQGFGYTGGMKEFMNDLGDLLLGPVDPNAADRIGAIFMRAKEWGASIRELNDAIKDNPIAKFFAEMSGYGFQLFAWGMGISMLAGTIRKLAAALFVLSGASTLLGALKAVKGIADIVDGRSGGGGGGTRGAGNGNNANPRKNSTTAPWSGGFLNLFNSAFLLSSLPDGQDEMQDFMERNKKRWDGYNDWLEKNVGSPRSWTQSDSRPAPASVYSQMAMDNAVQARVNGVGGGSTDVLPGKTADDLGIRTVRIDASSMSEMIKPAGTQDVRVVNPQRPNVTIHAPISITGVADPQAAASQAVRELEGELSKLEGTFSD